jgi:homoserine kinase
MYLLVVSVLHAMYVPGQVAGILTGDVKLVGQALDSDIVIEPVRGPLIPGMMAVKEAAKAAGAGQIVLTSLLRGEQE